jgi:hypothetical protein
MYEQAAQQRVQCTSRQRSKEFNVQAGSTAKSSMYKQAAQQRVQCTSRQRSKEFNVQAGSAAKSSMYKQAAQQADYSGASVSRYRPYTRFVLEAKHSWDSSAFVMAKQNYFTRI